MSRYAWMLSFLLGCGPTVSTGDGQGEGSQGGTASSPTTSDAGTTSGSASTSSGQASTSTGTLGVPPPEGCECREAGLCAGVSTDCGGDEVCPAIVTDCARPVPYYGCIGQDVILDEAALWCALDALAERTPGWFDISLQDLGTGSCGLEGCSYETWRVHGLGDTGQAVVSNCYRVPLDEEPEVLDGLRSLETPGYFEACKDLEGGGAQLDCLFGGLRSGSAITCP